MLAFHSAFIPRCLLYRSRPHIRIKSNANNAIHIIVHSFGTHMNKVLILQWQCGVGGNGRNTEGREGGEVGRRRRKARQKRRRKKRRSWQRGEGGWMTRTWDGVYNSFLFIRWENKKRQKNRTACCSFYSQSGYKEWMNIMIFRIDKSMPVLMAVWMRERKRQWKW